MAHVTKRACHLLRYVKHRAQNPTPEAGPFVRSVRPSRLETDPPNNGNDHWNEVDRDTPSHTSLLGSYFLRAASWARISAAVIGRFSFLPSVGVVLLGSVVPLVAVGGVVPFSAILPTAAPSVTIIRIRPRIDHEQAGFVRYGFDQFDHLLVRFGRDVLTVHFDDAIALPETGRFCRRCVIHLANVLPGTTFFGVQVKPVPIEIRPLYHMAQPGLILRCGGAV
uniref:Uncharacterized protein n=1 Tax=Anopheles minimus TaxID=112268 RepID=A0A182W271_9DIPT